MRLLPNSEGELRQKESYKGMFSAFPLPKTLEIWVRFMSAVTCQSSDTEKKKGKKNYVSLSLQYMSYNKLKNHSTVTQNFVFQRSQSILETR